MASLTGGIPTASPMLEMLSYLIALFQDAQQITALMEVIHSRQQGPGIASWHVTTCLALRPNNVFCAS